MPSGSKHSLVAGAVALMLVAGSSVGIGAASAAVPAVTGVASFQMAGVSCVNASFCMAVGSSARRMSGVDIAGKTLVERWNGTTWSIVASPTPTGRKGAELQAVSCTSTTFCMAVGQTVDSSAISPPSRTFAERWNGTKWSIVASPNPASGRYNRLSGVSCTSPSRCMAVGGYLTPDARVPTLVELWNGTKWSILDSPNREFGLGGPLSAVSCPTARSCFVVGVDYVTENYQTVTMAMHWNGTTWSTVTGNSSTAYSALSGVSCVSTTNCTAVGYSRDRQSQSETTLVQHWNGTKWSTVKSRNPGPSFSQLSAVSCSGVFFCIAVGQYANASVVRTLVERWDGANWSNVNSPIPAGATTTQPAGVSCRSKTACVAVGHFTTSTDPQAGAAGPFKTLFQKWNGTKWSLVTSPAPPSAP